MIGPVAQLVGGNLAEVAAAGDIHPFGVIIFVALCVAGAAFGLWLIVVALAAIAKNRREARTRRRILERSRAARDVQRMLRAENAVLSERLGRTLDENERRNEARAARSEPRADQ